MPNLSELYDSKNDALRIFGATIGTVADFAGAVGAVVSIIQLLSPAQDPVAVELNQIVSILGDIDAQLKTDELESKWTAIHQGMEDSNTAFQARMNYFDSQGKPTVPTADLLAWLERLSSGIVFFASDPNLWGIARNVVPSVLPSNPGPLVPAQDVDVSVPIPPSGMSSDLDFFWPLVLPAFLGAITHYVIGAAAAGTLRDPASLGVYRSAYATLEWLYQAVASQVVVFPFAELDCAGWAKAHDPASANIYFAADLYGRGIVGGNYPYVPDVNGSSGGVAPVGSAPYKKSFSKLRLAQIWCVRSMMNNSGLDVVLGIIQNLRRIAGDNRYDAGRGPTLRNPWDPSATPTLPASLKYDGVSLTDLLAVAFDKRTGQLSDLLEFCHLTQPVSDSSPGSLLHAIAPAGPGGWPEWLWGIE